MDKSELVENVDRLFDQSETGNVDRNVALKVFSDAYAAIPNGGYIETSRSYTSFKNGARSWNNSDIDRSRGYFNNRTHNEEKGFPVCESRKGYDAQQCM